MNSHQQTNRLAVDIGGTFTDVVVETGGVQYAAKVLTTAEAPEKGVIEGITALLGEIGLSPGDLGLMVHGTTLATNAIIERKGALTALITTDGSGTCSISPTKGVTTSTTSIWINPGPWFLGTFVSPSPSVSASTAGC